MAERKAVVKAVDVCPLPCDSTRLEILAILAAQTV